MKKILLILLLTIPFIGFGQNPILEEKNGFKDIKLGSDVNNYSFIKPVKGPGVSVEVKKSMMYHGYPHVIHSDYIRVKNIKPWVVDENDIKHNTIGRGIKINKTVIFTYNSKIFKIVIIVDNPEGNNNLYKNFKSVFGEDTYIDNCPTYFDVKDPRKETCFVSWSSQNVMLSLMSHGTTNRKFPFKTHWEITYTDWNITTILDEKEKSLEKREDLLNKIKLSDGF